MTSIRENDFFLSFRLVHPHPAFGHPLPPAEGLGVREGFPTRLPAGRRALLAGMTSKKNNQALNAI
jgi:hypothetical protein